MSKRTLIVAFGLIVALATGLASAPSTSASAPAAVGDWPGPGNDSGFTYDNATESTITPANVSKLEANWTDTNIGGDRSEILVSAGRVFVDDGQKIDAVDAATGKALWTWGKAQQVRGLGGITTAGGLLYVGIDGISVHEKSGLTNVSAVAALDQRTGATKWIDPNTNPQASQVRSPIAVGDGRVFVAFSDGSGVALDAATGDLLWSRSDADQYILASGFTYSGGHLVASLGMRGGGAEATVFNPKTGLRDWESGTSEIAPTIVGSRMIAAGADGVEAISIGGCGAAICKPLWQNEAFANDIAGVAVSNRYVVVGLAGTGQLPMLAVLDIATGRTLWEAVGGPQQALVSIAGSVVYVTSEFYGAAAYPLNGCGASTCKPLWTTKSVATCQGCSRPVIAHGTFYLGEYSSSGVFKLAALRPPVATVYGPTFAHLGATVSLDGTAPPGSTVSVWFHRRDIAGFVKRRTLKTSSAGVWSTTYQPDDDYRYYATAAGTTSPTVLTQLSPTASGPSRVAAGHKVTISGTDRPGARLHVWFHRRNSTGYVMRRSVVASSTGHWSASYTADSDYRYYAVDLVTGQQSSAALTQIN